MARLAALALLALLPFTLAQPPSPAIAAWPPDGRALCTTDGRQQRPLAVPDGLGGAFVVWLDGRDDPAYDLYLAHVLASGDPDPVWPAEGLGVSTLYGSQVAMPAIIHDGTGDVIVVWFEGPMREIRAQRISAGGVPGWAPNGIIVHATADLPARADLIPDGSGGAIITWMTAWIGVPAGASDVYAMRVLASGAVDPNWPANGFPICVAVRDQLFPKIVSDGTGGAIIAWQDKRMGDYDVYAQHVLVTPSGPSIDPAWPTSGLPVCDCIGNQTAPILVPDGAGGAVVAWVDDASGNLDVYAQRIRNWGGIDPAWPPDGHEIAWEPGTQAEPVMVADGAGGAFIAWRDERTDEGDVYIHHMLGGGTLDAAWQPTGVPVRAAAGRQTNVALAESRPDAVMVAWTDLAGASAKLGIRRILKTGSADPTWPAEGQILCRESGAQDSVTLIADGGGGVIAAWQDDRSGSWDIYVQHVSAEGLVGNIVPDALTSSFGPDVAGGPAMDRLGASPANGCVPETAQYFYRVQLMDALGRPIAGFPADSVWLDFSACPPAWGRPVDGHVHPDDDSDAQGIVEWRASLAFGGADPNPIPVMVADGVSSGARMLHEIPGGVRSPDQDGDGLIDPFDLDAWNAARIAGGPEWIGDLGPSAAFDGLTTQEDSTALALHRGCGLYSEVVLDHEADHRVVIQGLVDHDARRIRGVIKCDGERVESSADLTPGADGKLEGTLALDLSDAERDIGFISRFRMRADPESLATEQDDTLSVCVPVPGGGGAVVMSDPEPNGVCLSGSINYRDGGFRFRGQVEYRQEIPSFDAVLKFKSTASEWRSRKSAYSQREYEFDVKGKNWDASVTHQSKLTDTLSTSSLTATVGARTDSVKFKGSVQHANVHGVEVMDRLSASVEIGILKSARVSLSGEGDARGGSMLWTLGVNTSLLGTDVGVNVDWDRKNGFHQGGLLFIWGWTIPFGQGLEWDTGAQPLMVTEQRTQWWCDGVSVDLPARRDTVALADACLATWTRSSFGAEGCAASDSLAVEAVPCEATPVPTRLDAAPSALELGPIRPNPSTGDVLMAVALPRAGRLRIDVFDLQGRRVATVTEGAHGAGRDAFRWRACDGGGAALHAGVYIVRLSFENQARTRKFVLTR